MRSDTKLQTKILTRQSKPGEYNVYRAGLEWDLTDPIVIESSDDFKSTPQWRDRLKPYRHQVSNLITFCRRLPVTLLADDVGLGKTISAGLVMSELIVRTRLSKTLIVCPKLLGPQWKQELEEKFDISSVIAIGRELLSADSEEVEAAILSPSKQRLATCAESKRMLGLRVQQVGAVYDLVDDAIIGRLAEGKRNGSGWVRR